MIVGLFVGRVQHINFQVKQKSTVFRYKIKTKVGFRTDMFILLDGGYEYHIQEQLSDMMFITFNCKMWPLNL